MFWLENKGSRGGIHQYAAQARPQIDTARAGKYPFLFEFGQRGFQLPEALVFRAVIGPFLVIDDCLHRH